MLLGQVSARTWLNQNGFTLSSLSLSQGSCVHNNLQEFSGVHSVKYYIGRVEAGAGSPRAMEQARLATGLFAVGTRRPSIPRPMP